MDLDDDNSAAWPRLVNVGAFALALVGLGVALVVAPTDDASIAEDEQRTLAPPPVLTFGTLADGAFAEATEAWIADHFPLRARFMAAHFWLAAHRGFADERVAFYDVDVAADDDLAPVAAWEDEGAAPVDPDQDAAWIDEMKAVIAADTDGDTDGGLEGFEGDTDGLDDLGELEASGPAAPREARREGGILVVDGRAMQLFSGRDKGARGYARMINEYEEVLRGKARVYSMIVPTAQTFYLPDEFARFARPEPPNIAATYALMVEAVTTVDVVAALQPHVDEYIYFRGDHHWTGRGAYYAYTAFCAAAGLEPLELDAMVKAEKDGFRGSLYRFTHDPKLAGNPDVVEYWLPPVETSVVRYSPELIRVPIKGPLIRERGAHYGVFLGGDFPLIIAKTDQNPGRRALLIKNSFGNPFAVYLAAHFEETLIVDYRYFNGSVLDLIRDHKVTDVVIMNGTFTANSRFHAARVGWVMDGGKRSRKARKAAAKAAAAASGS